MKSTILLLTFLLFSFAALAENIAVSARFMQYENLLACTKGGTRIKKVYHTTKMEPSHEFHLTTILHPSSYAEGALEGQVSDDIFFGTSNFNDILGVQTLRDKDQKIIGANVYLSFCQYSPLLVEGREFSDFQTPLGILLTESTTPCTHGDATALQATLFAEAFENYPSVTVNTSFAPNQVLKVCRGEADLIVTDGTRQTGEDIPKVETVSNSNESSSVTR